MKVNFQLHLEKRLELGELFQEYTRMSLHGHSKI